ncbi:MAG: metalloregulator ArsR/SmtB family transcription factor [Candidatus Paceibacterota bacterium]
MTHRKQPITKTATASAVSILKLLSSKTRFQILTLLMKSKGDPCVNEIADTIGISQSATSHQLALLEEKDVVEAYREGQMICYHLKDSPTSKHLRKIINQFV